MSTPAAPPTPQNITPSARARLRAITEEFLTLPTVPVALVYALVNLIIQLIKILPIPGTQSPPPQTPGPSSTNQAPIFEIRRDDRIRHDPTPRECHFRGCHEEVLHTCLSDTHAFKDLRWRAHCRTHVPRSCPLK